MDGIKWLANELGHMKWLEALDDLDAEIIVALADYDMNAAEVARQLYMHRSSIVYHAKKIHKATGKNILNFYDLCEMLPIAQRKCEAVRR